MKLLVSDYDGTYKIERNDTEGIKKNNVEIQRFLDKGNLFAFATARSYISIMKEIDKHNIPYDYLICNDGLFIIDKYGKIIYEKLLDSDLVKNINDFLYQYTSHIAYLDKYGKLVKEDIMEIIAYLDLLQNPEEILKKLNANELLYAVRYLNQIYIKNKTNKSIGINHLLNSIDLNPDVVTVGDDANDIEMLKDFKGYRMLTCYPILYKEQLKTTTSVKSLVRKL